MRAFRWSLGVLFFVFAVPSLAPAAPQAPAQKPDSSKEIIATVAGEPITLRDLDRFIEQLPQNVQMIAQSRKAEILQSMIHRALMFRYAQEKKLGETDRVKSEVARARREILIREAVRAVEEEAKPTAKELQAEYDKNKDKYQEGDKVTASHIMVATEKEAQDLVAKLKKGENFTELAKKYSLAPERDKGGSLGAMERGHHRLTGLPEIIEQTAFSLEAGAHSSAVKSVYGWHVVRTEKKEQGRQLTFAEAQSPIEKTMNEERRQAALEKILDDLSKKYPVQRFPERLR